MALVERQRIMNIYWETSNPSSVKFNIGKIPYGTFTYTMKDSRGEETSKPSACVSSLMTFSLPHDFVVDREMYLSAKTDSTNGLFCAVAYPGTKYQNEFIADFGLEFLHKRFKFHMIDDPYFELLGKSERQVELSVSNHIQAEVIAYQATFTMLEQVRT